MFYLENMYQLSKDPLAFKKITLYAMSCILY